MSKLESKFQASLIKELKDMFPGCVVLKNDARQGMPDLLILYYNMWAALETKRAFNSKRQPNQEYYVELLDDMSFASFICPENKWEVLDDLQRAFSFSRRTRIPKR